MQKNQTKSNFARGHQADKWAQCSIILEQSFPDSRIAAQRNNCMSDTFIAKENKDIRLVQQQTKHLCKCKYVNNDYASCGPQA